MNVWIQPCAPGADLYRQPASAPHHDLTLNGAGAVKDARLEVRWPAPRPDG
jgi:hypothetical protein